MGVSATHYVVFGVVEQDKAKVKDFFRNTENDDEHHVKYYDNGYRSEVTPNESGVHVIEDGMLGCYVVLGKILYKSLNGPCFVRMTDFESRVKKEDGLAIAKAAQALDAKFASRFSKLKHELIVFTHYH